MLCLAAPEKVSALNLKRLKADNKTCEQSQKENTIRQDGVFFLELHFYYARETRLRFPLHTFPSLRYAGVRTTKVVGNHIKNYRYRCVWHKARRINRFRS